MIRNNNFIFRKILTQRNIIIISFPVLSIIFIYILFINNNKTEPGVTRPLIVFNEETHNFGKVKEGPRLEFIFKFTNKGKGTLKISGVTSRCGCIAAEPDKKDYQPGESGEIKVLFNTQGRSGNQEKEIKVTTNDPANLTKTLKIISEIER